MKQIISYNQLKDLGISYSRTHVARLQDPDDPCYDPTFPKSFSLSPKPRSRRVWWLEEFIVWLETRAKAR